MVVTLCQDFWDDVGVGAGVGVGVGVGAGVGAGVGVGLGVGVGAGLGAFVGNSGGARVGIVGVDVGSGGDTHPENVTVSKLNTNIKTKTIFHFIFFSFPISSINHPIYLPIIKINV